MSVDDQNERMIRDMLSGGPADEAAESNETFEEPFAEPKRGINQSTLVMVVLLAAVVGVTYFMVLHSGPSGAQGATAGTVDSTGQTIDMFLSGGANDLQSAENKLHKTQQLVARFRADPTESQVPLDDLKTNPFQISHGTTQPTADAVQLDADARAAAEAARRQVIMTAAGQLHVQSVVFGRTTRSCVIDGRLYLEGDSVGLFKLEAIRAQSIVVSGDGLKLEIKMLPANGR